MLIDSRKLTAWNVRKNDVWTRSKLCSLNDVKIRFSKLIRDGYEIVEAPTSGTIDLTSYSNSEHKYLLIWKDIEPTGTITVDESKTLYDSGGSIISNGGNVVIFGVKINSVNQVKKYLLEINFDVTDGDDYSHVLHIEYAKINIVVSLNKILNQIDFNFSILTGGPDAYANFPDIVNSNMNNVDCYNVNYGSSGVPTLLNQCRIIETIGGKHLDINMLGTLQNCVLKNETTAFFQLFGTIATKNTMLHIGGFILDFDSDDKNNILYANNANFYPIASGYKDVILENTNKTDSEILNRRDSLDTAALQNVSNYKTLAATVVQERRSFRGTLGRIKRQYYNVRFEQDKLVDPGFKYFDDDDLLIVKREEEEAVLISDSGGPRKIKSLTFYENDGATEYNYRNDENFLIIADDGAGIKAVFAWYKGALRPTVFSDVWDDTVYTIETVFQIWRPPSDISIRNMWMTNDGPLSGNVLYKDLTSVVVIP